MKVYKVWNTKAQAWMATGSLTGGSRKGQGKIWQTAGRLKQALTYLLPCAYRWRKPELLEANEAIEDRHLGNKEVVTYVLTEVDRMPLKTWYIDNNLKYREITRKGIRS